MNRLKSFKIIITVVVVTLLALAAVLTALRQSAGRPAAPTVPQATPHAQEPATTPACSLFFTVIAQKTVCDSLVLDVTSGPAPLKVHATVSGHATPSAALASYQIDFGDGSASYSATTARSVEHQYNNSGTYTIKGAVTDSLGNVSAATDACQVVVTVGPPPATYTYRTCQNNACVAKSCDPATTPCPGLSNCTSDADCAAKTYQHKVCLGSACASVDCSPSSAPCADSCTTASDCATGSVPPPAPPTHKECRNKSCVTVTGAGSDSCTSDVSCQPAATPPPIPKSGNTALTIAGLVLGVGALALGLLLL